MLGQLGGAPSCPSCDQRVYFSDEKAFAGNKWHKKCFSCSLCRKVLENSTAVIMPDAVLCCKSCHQKLVPGSPEPRFKPPLVSQTSVTYVNHEDPSCCPRCGKRVYFAEQVLAVGRKWHKPCFSCFECHKTIDVMSARDHDQELYCKTCHGRLFGPKGFGFAGGAGTMLSMDTGKYGNIPSSNIPAVAQAYVAPVMSDAGMAEGNLEGTNICPRCTKQVFIAEKKQAAGKSYHLSCFTCLMCNKKLDSSILTEKEGEIYCKACYGKNFAPKGYGYGVGAGTLQMS